MPDGKKMSTDGHQERKKCGVKCKFNKTLIERENEGDVEVEGGTQQRQGQANCQVAMWQFADKARD